MSKKQKILIALTVALLLIGITLFIIFFRTPSRIKSVNLNFWGVYNDTDVLREISDGFSNAYKWTNIKFYHRADDIERYRKDLIDAFSKDQAPDIFMIHNTWLPIFKDLIVPLSPKITFTSRDLDDLKTMTEIDNYEKTYVQVVVDDFVDKGAIWAIPLYVDTLALYYNKDLFNTTGIIQPPSDWDEFMADVEKLKIKNDVDDIIRAGAIMGTAKNINRATDILYLLMLQQGTRMVDQERTKATFNATVEYEGRALNPGQRALQFYTDFANPFMNVYTWNNRIETKYSIDAFAEGQAAMMLNYAYTIPTIRNKNPYLNFDVAPAPQIKDAKNKVNYANYWGVVVSKKTKDPNRAWEFLLWLAKRENIQKYLEGVNRPTARRDQIEIQKKSTELDVFVDQLLTARSWYQVDNLAIEPRIQDMIESVVSGEATVNEAIKKASDNVTHLMQQNQ